MSADYRAITGAEPLFELRAQIRNQALCDENICVQALIDNLRLSPGSRVRIVDRATKLVAGARRRTEKRPALDALLQEFSMSNAEGIALMCLAEGLLRIPDNETADQLIAEKIAAGDWSRHVGQSASTFVNTSTRGLQLAACIVRQRVGAPFLRIVLRRAMRIIGDGFVMGRTIEEALQRSERTRGPDLCSFDMLGEGARTMADANKYRNAYEQALDAIGKQRPDGSLHERSSLSVKLSALEPRYDLLRKELVMRRLVPVISELARRAAAAGVGLTIDAEEAERLDLSLDVFAALAQDESTKDWEGLGLVVQAYGKRAPFVIDWLAAVARSTRRRICVRLVKGAYWDSEIKRAQERGLSSYPVYTRKASTDVAYLACCRRLFAHSDAIYPQFATHNAHTIAAVLELRPKGSACEFQRLHGMGGMLYEEAQRQIPDFPRVRTYAPVGSHEELLSYLMRRLLENGANTSFVNRFMDDSIPVAVVVRDPLSYLETQPPSDHRIPLPERLFGDVRVNSQGIDWGNPLELERHYTLLSLRFEPLPSAAPTSTVAMGATTQTAIVNPANVAEVVGYVTMATPCDVAAAFDHAGRAQHAWDAAGANHRADCLVRTADALRRTRPELIRLLVKEAGKTLTDAIAEAREAEDFCRYYAECARTQFAVSTQLPGPTGESNCLSLHGRGAFACISPWNFPLAIFLGQIAAALAAGNTVVAKPAESTPLIASLAVRLLHHAGVPREVLHFVPAVGRVFGEIAFQHRALAGVAFTGSTATARLINRALAARDGAIVPLIAETGGINAMIVDSSALLEQVADDVLTSAFASAGQRCSALRLLFVHADVADRLIELIAGGMDELIIGDPASPATDVGPLIDIAAVRKLTYHSETLLARAQLLKQCKLSSETSRGHFFAPRLFEVASARDLTEESFGPVLHLVRYRSEQIDDVLAAIRESGYGLTLGVHTRIDAMWRKVVADTTVGNTYVNRNMIGAVVGVQPFGGEGLSGTGPKAGGPNYLLRFASERTLTLNLVASGGNTHLLTLGDP